MTVALFFTNWRVGLVIALTLFNLRCSCLQAQPVKLNNAYSLACHNCFETSVAPNIEDVLNYTTKIEIDIWDNEVASGFFGSLLGKKMNNDWYVKHSPTDKGNVNNCGCSLKGYLSTIKQWSETHPSHKPLIIFLDKKENWSDPDEKRLPVHLDNLVASIFSKDKIYSPLNLKSTFLNLREATANNNWPLLDSLKGKIMFIITDGSTFNQRNNNLNKYLDARGDSAICFVAPEIKREGDLQVTPGISNLNQTKIVIFNLEFSNSGLTETINRNAFLSRIYNAPENKQTFDALRSNHVNFIAMFNYRDYTE